MCSINATGKGFKTWDRALLHGCVLRKQGGKNVQQRLLESSTVLVRGIGGKSAPRTRSYIQQPPTKTAAGTNKVTYEHVPPRRCDRWHAHKCPTPHVRPHQTAYGLASPSGPSSAVHGLGGFFGLGLLLLGTSVIGVGAYLPAYLLGFPNCSSLCYYAAPTVRTLAARSYIEWANGRAGGNAI